jgi:hypothetical protein
VAIFQFKTVKEITVGHAEAVEQELAPFEIRIEISEAALRFFERARIRAAQKSGELSKKADAEALAILASATLHTIAIRARAGAERAELEKRARQAVAVACAA